MNRVEKINTNDRGIGFISSEICNLQNEFSMC